jgi:hypothetical protein
MQSCRKVVRCEAARLDLCRKVPKCLCHCARDRGKTTPMLRYTAWLFRTDDTFPELEDLMEAASISGVRPKGQA